MDSLHPESEDSKRSDFESKIKEIREMVDEFSESNPKMGALLTIVVDEIEKDYSQYLGRDISEIINRMRYEAVKKEIEAFAKKWFIDPNEIWYHVQHFHNGIIDNETNLKNKAQYADYKASVEHPMIKLQFKKTLVEEFKNELMESIAPLLS